MTSDYTQMTYAGIEQKVCDDMGTPRGAISVIRETPKFKMLCIALQHATASAGALARGAQAARRELEDVERLAMGTVPAADGGYTARIPVLKADFEAALAVYHAQLRMALAA
jgi:hypothetical protein